MMLCTSMDAAPSPEPHQKLLPNKRGTFAESKPKKPKKSGIRSRSLASAKGSSSTRCSTALGTPSDGVRRPRRAVTTSLSSAAVTLVLNGIKHARRIGRPPNVFVTINWDKAEVADPADALQLNLKRVRDWYGPGLTYAWVMERGEHLGVHTHFMIHIPPEKSAAFHRKHRRWLKSAGGSVQAKGIKHSRTIGHSIHAAQSTDKAQESYLVNLERVTEYVLKGASSDARHLLDSLFTPCTGIIIGKRAGVSRTIGAAAIAEFHASQRKYAST